ncbi:N-acetylmuramoyl-L-alanine amidase [Campylobacter gracilis]|uniref:N-acetylmuramoyl-L-alanine amidase n=1 Tax=Campylobacter gracilis RM3268 TaxID=553220 RepID=C8PJY6_9BACT|nr:N-acetylmuramoyl-L-alanine amidase [Campylobacter gracilis]AKT92162.1 N-acetylmuramoyl-L-alanine amidase [Campylobacter gracilis]EEV17241.1 N-acetylmuramoyl-L-alanine amidase [Campylobacter gracilis RM3268]UEB45646.1 N-acetylmuramoyl-L-alanine amidase [Campylobacter gracilis]SUW81677.1 N-acetylmuramoyl-L-alanine amidase domain-containing protein [Campylobacter gracilis]
MAKIVKIFLIAAFSCVLAFGASSEAFFAKFDKDFIVATPNYKRSLHKELKSLYQGASDKEVRIKALKRLVYSSKNLGLDSSAYEKELARINTKDADKTKSKSSSDESKQSSSSAEKKSSKNSKKTSSASNEDSQASSSSKTKSTKSKKSSEAENSKSSSNLADKNPKASASENSKASTSKNSSAKKTQAAKNADLSSLSKEDLEFLRSTRPIGADEAVDSQEDDGGEDAIAQNEDEEEAADQSSELRKSSVKKADKNAQLALNSLRGDKNEIVLEFNRDLSQSDYKDFTIASNDHFRFVIDFSARQKSQKTRLKDSFVSDVRVSQYNDKTVRIVLSDPKEFNANVEINGNMMILSTAEGLKAAKSARAEKNKDQKSGRKRGREQDSEPQVSTIDETQGAKTVSVAAGKIYKSTKGKLIVIDPGHGGSDSGAVGNGLKEKNVVLATSKKLGALLTKRGYKVLYTRSTDVFINLRSRTAFAAKKNADMFISIHANAAPNASSALKMSGVETFFLSPARSERSKNAAALENRGDLEDMNTFSKQTFLNFLNREKIISSNKLAIDIQSYMLSSVKKSFSSKDGGVREAPFWVLVGATMPAVLVEIGYITHPQEGKNLGKSAYQDRIAQGIANGVDAYFQKNK